MGVTTPRVEADLGWALGRVARAHLRTAQDVVAGLPGGPGGYQVLAGLAGGPPRTQLALARTLGLDRTVMTYLLDELEGADLVARRPDPADRRARQVLLTDTGRMPCAKRRRVSVSRTAAEGTRRERAHLLSLNRRSLRIEDVCDGFMSPADALEPDAPAPFDCAWGDS